MKAVVPYQEGVVTLNPHDVLVLFTDGVSEAMNEHGDEFGEERIEQISHENMDQSAQSVLFQIVDAVKTHSKHVPQSDDITLVVAKALA